MAKLTRKAHTASNDMLRCAHSHRARPLRRLIMRIRTQFGIAALLALTAFVFGPANLRAACCDPSGRLAASLRFHAG